MLKDRLSLGFVRSSERFGEGLVGAAPELVRLRLGGWFVKSSKLTLGWCARSSLYIEDFSRAAPMEWS